MAKPQGTAQQGEAKSSQQEKQPTRRGWWAEPEKRLRVWVATLVALTLLFLFLIAQSPEGWGWLAKVQAFWQERERAKEFQTALAKDPPIGTSLEHLGLNRPPFTTHPSLPLLLVVFKGCEGCGAQKLKEWAEVLGEWETWRRHLLGVLVVQDKEEKVREIVKKNGWKVTVIADEDGRIGKALNAFFMPRAYGFEGGKLVWVQKEVGMGVAKALESFLGRIRGEEAVKELLNAWAAEMREKAWGKETAELAKGGRK